MASNNAYGLQGNGTNTRVSIGSANPNLPLGDSSRTIEFWYKPNNGGLVSPTSGFLVGYGSNTSGGRFNIYENLYGTNSLAVNISSYTAMTPDNILTPYFGQWIHVAVTQNQALGNSLNTSVKLYINGVEVPLIPHATQTHYDINTGSSSNFEILARHSYGDYFSKSAIDELRVFSYSKTPLKINQDMYKVLTPSEYGLVAYYRFEEGLGTLAIDSSSTNASGTIYSGNYTTTDIGLMAGQTIEEIGIPINIGKGTYINTEYVDGKIRLKRLYKVESSNDIDENYYGQGTASQPYLIYTPRDLYNMRIAPDKYYKMMTDIDMSEYPFNDGSWVNFDFFGTLDGNGYSIKNFTMIQYARYGGLFRYLTGANIKNLKIEKAYVYNNFETYTGILAGYSNGTTLVENCQIEGKVVLRDKSGTLYGSGFIGYMGGNSKAYNLVLKVDVDLDDPSLDKNYVGIITGRLDGACDLDSIIVHGDLIGNTVDHSHNGILIGYNYVAGLTNLYYNKEMATLGTPVSNNNVLTDVDCGKTETQLGDASLYVEWSRDSWNIRNYSIPNLKVFNKTEYAIASFGEWESEMIDLVDKYRDYKNLVRLYEAYGNAKITMFTKSSQDNVVWSNYQKVDNNGKMYSPKARYIRVKIQFNAEEKETKTLVESFNGDINYDFSNYVTLKKGVMTLTTQEYSKMNEVEAFSGNGKLYKGSFNKNGKRKVHKYSIYKK